MDVSNLRRQYMSIDSKETRSQVNEEVNNITSESFQLQICVFFPFSTQKFRLSLYSFLLYVVDILCACV